MKLKFRCWNGETMVSPDYIDRDGVAYWKENSIPNSTDKVVLFTGLHDKHGKEIYEGDILLIPVYPTNSNPLGEPDMGVVEVVAGAFGWRYLDYKGERTGEFNSFLSWNGESKTLAEEEVIGNVYENPELIREVK